MKNWIRNNISMILLIASVTGIILADAISIYIGGSPQDQANNFWFVVKLSILISITAFIPTYINEKKVIIPLCMAAIAFRWLFKGRLESPFEYSAIEFIYLGLVICWGIYAYRMLKMFKTKIDLTYYLLLIVLIIINVIGIKHA